MVLGRSAKIVVSLFVILVVLFFAVFGISKLRFSEEVFDAKIVATGEVYDFVKEVVGDGISVKKLQLAGNEHIAEPTPRDIIAIVESKVFVYSDEHADEWVEMIFGNIDTEKTRVVKIEDGEEDYAGILKEVSLEVL